MIRLFIAGLEIRQGRFWRTQQGYHNSKSKFFGPGRRKPKEFRQILFKKKEFYTGGDVLICEVIMREIQAARRFVDAINEHDIDALYGLMASNHRFIDGMGTVMTGREDIKRGWAEYFKMVPDYVIEIRETFKDADTVVFLGWASGTYTADGTLKKENYWKTPVALRAVVDGDKVTEWQVFADNEPIRTVMRREGTLK
jgi:ketosteroid isomerase-like protein